MTRRALILLAFAFACAAQPSRPPDDGISARAAEIVAEARAVEPEVTAMLVALAAELDGQMIKLEHRLKTRASTERKLHKMLSEKRQPVASMRLDDSLRYTIRFDDEPAGHYMESANETLRRLEARGHRVELVKNYWPAKDNYSGINTILRSPSGLKWELQFHTSKSLEVQARTRAWYEELRKEETPLPRKRELFAKMSRAWDDVAIPAGALDPAHNHARAEIVHRPQP